MEAVQPHATAGACTKKSKRGRKPAAKVAAALATAEPEKAGPEHRVAKRRKGAAPTAAAGSVGNDGSLPAIGVSETVGTAAVSQLAGPPGDCMSGAATTAALEAASLRPHRPPMSESARAAAAEAIVRSMATKHLGTLGVSKAEANRGLAAATKHWSAQASLKSSDGMPPQLEAYGIRAGRWFAFEAGERAAILMLPLCCRVRPLRSAQATSCTQ